MKRSVYKAVIMAAALWLTGCERGEDSAVFTFKDGKFYVWDNSVTDFMLDSYNSFANFEEGQIYIQHNYSIEVPDHNPADYSSWIRNNTALIDKMTQQWRKSSYYDRNKATTLEFTHIKSISVIANQTLWGREKGEELADMFLIQAMGPYFTFPDGDMLGDDGLGEWMSIEEWTSKGCVAASYRLRAKDNSGCGDTVILYCEEVVRDSWDNVDITRRMTYSLKRQSDGKYLRDISWWGEEEITFEEEWNSGRTPKR